jgi:hypothetical protein
MELSIENKMLTEHMLQEAFLDSVKDYANEKYNQVITKINDWKDAATIIGKVISNPTVLDRFSDNVWYDFKRNILSKLIAFLEKIGLKDLINQINTVVNKITNLNGWQKFLAATGIGAIANYILEKMTTFSPSAIRTFIGSYLSDSGLKNIISKLTDFKSYLGWLQPIIKGVDMLYSVLKSTIDKFKSNNQLFSQSINLIKKEHMDLKDQIKEIIRKMLDEESVSGDIGVGAGPISTPNWVAPKGQKKNKATKYAEKMGYKVVKGMPKNSKMLDYKELWKGKKSAMNEDKVQIDDVQIGVSKEVFKDLEANGFIEDNQVKGLFNTARKEDRKNLSIETKEWIQQKLLPLIKQKRNTKINESIDELVKSKLLNEVSYGKFKKDISYRSKTEMLHKGIKEVKRKIQEIDRIVEYTSRMKQELSEGDAVQYWTRTEAQLQQISEMVNNLNEKINKLK